MTRVVLDIQHASNDVALPEDEEIASWVECAVNDQMPDQSVAELNVRIVDSDEISELNSTYRNKSGPTNVLSFPFELPPGFPTEENYRILGDIVICAPVVEQEAEQQQKPPKSHWAHMVMHGALHLLGYDHQTNAEAERMENLETALLHQLSFPDPYQTEK